MIESTHSPAMRKRRCAICRGHFSPRSMTHKACSAECAATLAAKVREKIERKELAARKLAIKRRRDWLQEAQQAVNAWIRARDALLPCISCGRHHQGQFHAGHYRSVGAAPQLRFNDDNIHKQCSVCNNHKSGNAIEYRLGLIARIGEERVIALESDNSVRRWTIEDAKAIKAEYRARLKALDHA